MTSNCLFADSWTIISTYIFELFYSVGYGFLHERMFSCVRPDDKTSPPYFHFFQQFSDSSGCFWSFASVLIVLNSHLARIVVISVSLSYIVMNQCTCL